MKKIILLMTVLSVVSIGWSQTKKTKEFHGVTFYTETTINEEEVVINGAGVREKYFMDMYVAALYLKKKSTDASKIITADEEMGIHIKIVSSMVTRDKFKTAVTEGFKNATSGKATQEEQKKFMTCLSEEFKSGDKIYFDYVPSKGLKIYKNGDLKGTIPGLDFKKALFSIWLGTSPAQESLKNEMLGKE